MPHCQALIQTLRQQGLRITPQREMIIEALAHQEGHVTAESIFEAVQTRTRSINIATVYRTLDMLVERGLANRADLGNGRLVYVTRQHWPHMHLLCRACGQVIRADAGRIVSRSQAMQGRYGFAADLNHLCIPGQCAGCISRS